MPNLQTIKILMAIAIAVAIIGYFRCTLETDKLRYALHENSPIRLIRMSISNGKDPDHVQDFTITDAAVLDRINRTFVFFKEFTPGPGHRTVSIRLDIYKKRTIHMEVYKKPDDGWIVDIPGATCKNDSLVRVLTEFTPLE
jgi:hypothetical protein